jgi:hypothetical protein
MRIRVPRSSLSFALSACVLLASSGAARAQDSEVTATALFNDGRRLMNAHQYAQACPKFAESERLAPSGGTLLNLAECYERTGQTASAWAAWNDAAARANAAGKTAAEKSALARAAALEAKLSKLTIALEPESDVPGLTVKRDGVAVGHGEFGVALPIDPGPHVIEASAPKKQPWSTQIEVSPKTLDARVRISLADAPEQAAVAPAGTGTEGATNASPTPPIPSTEPQARPSSWSGQKSAAIVVGGAGIVGIALGAVFGLQAKSKNDDALQPANCPTPTQCNPSGLSLTDDAKTDATISTIAFVAGGAALIGGVVLWWTAPRASSSVGIDGVVPVVGSSYQGVALHGAW